MNIIETFPCSSPTSKNREGFPYTYMHTIRELDIAPPPSFPLSNIVEYPAFTYLTYLEVTSVYTKDSIP